MNAISIAPKNPDATGTTSVHCPSTNCGTPTGLLAIYPPINPAIKAVFPPIEFAQNAANSGIANPNKVNPKFDINCAIFKRLILNPVNSPEFIASTIPTDGSSPNIAYGIN